MSDAGGGNPTYILLMGVQGAGKGTQAGLLRDALGLPHVSTGDLFRAMKTLDTPLARAIQQTMNEGRLISDDTTLQVVRERLTRPDAAKGVLFDGFPRTIPQAEGLDKLLAELNSKVALALFLNLNREAAIDRIASRWHSQTDASRIYNVRTNPPRTPGIDDVDGLPLIQRPDDTPEAAATRIDIFFRDTAPLLDYYRKAGVLVEIDADQPIQAVTEACLAAIRRV